MLIHSIDQTDSTNNYVATHVSELEDMTMVIAREQSAGRGQRGNSWESEPGKNLTFTVLFRPGNIHPRDQFAISEATALAITDYLAMEGVEAKVKWPNDIYVGDRKIAGILIEHSVTPGNIEHSRIGVGININQTEFRSNAPNPVSLAQITGCRYDLSLNADKVGGFLEKRLAECDTAEGRRRLHEQYKAALWRGDGSVHGVTDKTVGIGYPGVIKDVDPHGPITIINVNDGKLYTYNFKEIEFML